MAKTTQKTDTPKLYKGYFNYYKNADTQRGLRQLKTYHFKQIPKSEVAKLRKIFTNTNENEFIGEKVVRDRSLDKNAPYA